jgi:hypothetical protein
LDGPKRRLWVKLSDHIIPENYRMMHDNGYGSLYKQGKALNKILELSAINKKGDSFPIELTPSNRARIFLVLSLETHNEKYSTKNTLGK